MFGPETPAGIGCCTRHKRDAIGLAIELVWPHGPPWRPSRVVRPACGSCLPSGGPRCWVVGLEVETEGGGRKVYESVRMSAGKARDLRDRFAGPLVGRRAWMREVVPSKSLAILDNGDPEWKGVGKVELKRALRAGREAEAGPVELAEAA